LKLNARIGNRPRRKKTDLPIGQVADEPTIFWWVLFFVV